MKKILILNGSLGGRDGYTQYLISQSEKFIKNYGHAAETIHLKDFLDKKITLNEMKTKLMEAHGVVMTSGTYWDSWGSPMQYFLEAATEFEASDIFMGKPAAVLITMHSVGGKSVLSRLQGVLNTLGFMIPPMSGMVYSLAGKLALETDSNFAEDFWGMEDLEIIIHNLVTTFEKEPSFKPWPVDHKDPKRIWIK